MKFFVFFIFALYFVALIKYVNIISYICRSYSSELLVLGLSVNLSQVTPYSLLKSIEFLRCLVSGRINDLAVANEFKYKLYEARFYLYVQLFVFFIFFLIRILHGV